MAYSAGRRLQAFAEAEAIARRESVVAGVIQYKSPLFRIAVEVDSEAYLSG
jgi:hypothetical protein